MVDFKQKINQAESQFDFGFGGEEFVGDVLTVPYAQFINSAEHYGIGITSENQELAEFKLKNNWKKIQYTFNDGTKSELVYNDQPRLIVLNKSRPLMSNGERTIVYDREIAEKDETFKSFSYAIVWFLDQQNEPISELPFRIKLSGYAGLTFLKNYQYYNNPHSFSKKFLAVYKELSGDRSLNKNNIFYAHAVYCPRFIRDKVKSAKNNQSSFAVQVKDFLEPSRENFLTLIIKNGSETSNRIKEAIETTSDWFKNDKFISDDDESNNTESSSQSNNEDEFDELLESEGENNISPSLASRIAPVKPPELQDGGDDLAGLEKAQKAIAFYQSKGWTFEAIRLFVGEEYTMSLEEPEDLQYMMFSNLKLLCSQIADLKLRDRILEVSAQQQDEIPF